MKIKDYFKAMYESTTIIIDDDNSDMELYRDDKKDLPKEFCEKEVIHELGIMEINKWYFWV